MKNMKTRIFPVLAALVISAMAMPGTSQAAADVTAPARASACTTVVGSAGIVTGNYMDGQGTNPMATVVIRVALCVDKSTAKITSASAPVWSFKDIASYWRLNSAVSLPKAPPVGTKYYPFNGSFNWSAKNILPGVNVNNVVTNFQVYLETRFYNSSWVQACLRVGGVSATNVRNARLRYNEWSCVLMSR